MNMEKASQGSSSSSTNAEYNKAMNDFWSRVPRGIYFKPSDEELVTYYLYRKVNNLPLPLNKINEADVYSVSPDQLISTGKYEGCSEMYFFTPRKRKYPNGKRPRRNAGDGRWKATGTDTIIDCVHGTQSGLKKVLVFHRGEHRRDKTDWVMHEYVLSNEDDTNDKNDKNDKPKFESIALCKIYKKSNNVEADVEDEEPVVEKLPHPSMEVEAEVNVPVEDRMNDNVVSDPTNFNNSTYNLAPNMSHVEYRVNDNVVSDHTRSNYLTNNLPSAPMYVGNNQETTRSVNVVVNGLFNNQTGNVEDLMNANDPVNSYQQLLMHYNNQVNVGIPVNNHVASDRTNFNNSTYNPVNNHVATSYMSYAGYPVNNNVATTNESHFNNPVNNVAFSPISFTANRMNSYSPVTVAASSRVTNAAPNLMNLDNRVTNAALSRRMTNAALSRRMTNAALNRRMTNAALNRRTTSAAPNPMNLYNQMTTLNGPMKLDNLVRNVVLCGRVTSAAPNRVKDNVASDHENYFNYEANNSINSTSTGMNLDNPVTNENGISSDGMILNNPESMMKNEEAHPAVNNVVNNNQAANSNNNDPISSLNGDSSNSNDDWWEKALQDIMCSPANQK